MSRCIILLTYDPAYAPFTPSDSEQRLDPTYYRGCWHVVSRSLFKQYRHVSNVLFPRPFFPFKRALQSENLHHSRGVAASDFRPLRKIPYCCLPKESGPFLSPNVSVHPLRPDTHHSLGGPLPRQLTNGPQAHPQTVTFKKRSPLEPDPCRSGTTSRISPALAGLSWI